MRKITSFTGGIIAGLLTTIIAFSCSKENNSDPVQLVAPKIENVELGHNNSKTAEIGDEVHVEATITAEANIKELKLQINSQKGTSSFKVEETFPKSAGVKGYNIHQHFDIPEDATEGDYDFLLSVTDQNNQTTEVKDVLKITKKINFTEDESLPLSTLQLGVLNKSIAMGKDDFIAKLGNISYKSIDATTLVYYATREQSPFKKYEIYVYFENVFDLDVRPYEIYEGVGKIIIKPVDEQNNDAKNEDVKTVLHYFEDYITTFNQKVMHYNRSDDEKEYSESGFTKEEFYNSLSNKNLASASANILWNNNYNASALESSKTKNTPIINVNYFAQKYTYEIILEFNRPRDFFDYFK